MVLLVGVVSIAGGRALGENMMGTCMVGVVEGVLIMGGGSMEWMEEVGTVEEALGTLVTME